MARQPVAGGKGRKAPRRAEAAKDAPAAKDSPAAAAGRPARQSRPRREPQDPTVQQVLGEIAQIIKVGGLGPDLVVRVARLPHGQGLALPAHQSVSAAGLDLPAAVPAEAPLLIPPGGRALVPTGLVLEIAPGFEGQVRPRSGLALKHGVTVLNSPGTIDADYRGEVQVLLVNLGEAPFAVVRGERIAQLVFTPVAWAVLRQAGRVSATERGAGGFGSTGTRTTRGTRS